MPHGGLQSQVRHARPQPLGRDALGRAIEVDVQVDPQHPSRQRPLALGGRFLAPYLQDYQARFLEREDAQLQPGERHGVGWFFHR